MPAIAISGVAIGSAAAIPITIWFGAVAGGVVFGALAASAIWIPFFIVEQVTGAGAPAMGATAEGWTSTQVRRHVRNGAISIDRITLRGYDLDHAIISPIAAVAIETKWSSIPWQHRPVEDRLRSAAKQAERSARKLHEMLRQPQFHRLDVPVEPLVVVWGRTTWEGSEALRIDGITVVAGDGLGNWLDRWCEEHGCSDPRQPFDEAVAELRRYLIQRDEHDEAEADLPYVVRHGLGAIIASAWKVVVAAFSLVMVVAIGATEARSPLWLVAPIILIGGWAAVRHRCPLAGYSLLAAAAVLVASALATVATAAW